MDEIQQGELLGDLEQLESVEELLDYFSIDYDSEIVQSKHIPLLRLCSQILTAKRSTYGYHNYNDYRDALTIAYRQIAHGRLPAVNQNACATCQVECDQAG